MLAICLANHAALITCRIRLRDSYGQMLCMNALSKTAPTMPCKARTEPLQALPLPSELRLRIYENLLSPPFQPLRLYHDRLGRSKPMSLHSAILRVSRMTYNEAIPVLYSQNTFKIELDTRVVRQCTGGEYPDCYGSSAPLIKGAADKNCKHFEEQSCNCSQKAIIPSISLRSMQYIEIVTSWDAVWGDCEGGKYLSSIGQTVLPALLYTLGQPHDRYTTKGRKTLKFTAVDDLNTHASILDKNVGGFGKLGMLAEKPNDHCIQKDRLWKLLDLVREVRNVTICDAQQLVTPDDDLFCDGNEWTMETADVWRLTDWEAADIPYEHEDLVDLKHKFSFSSKRPFERIGTFRLKDL